MNSRLTFICAAAYAVMVVLCFGPATVQSERAAAEVRAQCRANNEGRTEEQKMCDFIGPRMSDGLPKALFWPLWLSYTAASSR